MANFCRYQLAVAGENFHRNFARLQRFQHGAVVSFGGSKKRYTLPRSGQIHRYAGNRPHAQRTGYLVATATTRSLTVPACR